ncbi:MAG TPA: hypothetical protein VMV71_01170 [Candidatus Paceibacterota bacterium]|nr:hypothetical protein [Candidatus Paceibacterota bacterium]
MNKNEGYPFNEKLEDLGVDRKGGRPAKRIRKFENRDDLVVRQYPLLKDVDKELEIATTMKGLLKELNDDYGIAVPEVRNVVGEIKGAMVPRKMFVITDKVIGKRLWELPRSEAIDKMNEFYLKIFKYLEDAYRYKKKFITDINSDQVMYGRKEGESSDKIYWVDVEPLFMEEGKVLVDLETMEKAPVSIREEVMYILDKIESVLGEEESYFEPPIKLTEAREALAELMGKIGFGKLEE